MTAGDAFLWAMLAVLGVIVACFVWLVALWSFLFLSVLFDWSWVTGSKRGDRKP